MEIGDILQWKIEGHWGDVDVNMNVFHGFNMEAGAEIIDLLTTLVGGMIPELQALYYSTTFIDRISGVNLFNPAETGEIWLGLDGSRVGIAEALPSQAAVTTRYFHDNGAIRTGFKRWWNPYEADQDDGVITAAMVDEYEAVSWAPILDLVEVCPYVIVKRIRKPGGPPYEYRLPENIGECDWGQVTDFDLNTRVSSQNSRKCVPI